MRRLVIPVLIGAVVGGGMMLVNWLGPEPVQATVTDRTITDNGIEKTRVEWDGGSAFVALPEGTEMGEEVPVIVPDSGDPFVGEYLISIPVVIGGTVLGLLLGFVVDYSLQGYGYVRGRGGVSETPDLNVAEDRGFYWRT